MATFKVFALVNGTVSDEKTGLTSDEALAYADTLHAKALSPKIEREPNATIAPVAPVVQLAPAPANDVAPAPAPVFSSFASTTIDATSKARIDAQQSALIAAGIVAKDAFKVGREQFFENGTRMMQSGYATQAARKAEHEAQAPIADVASRLASLVQGEKREDIKVSASDLGRSIDVNGKVKGLGFALSEQAIRGLLLRLDSPALSFVLGLRDRIAFQAAVDEAKRDVDAMKADKSLLAEILRHECKRAGNVELKLRTRGAIGDCFAIVSPSYAPADAPQVVSDIVAGMPTGARGTFAYDAKSTSWEIRASVWTPTLTEQQAVGEPFEGYVSMQSRDNGTGGFQGGGGINVLRCLNASTYVLDDSSARRRHVGRITYDIAAIVKRASKAAHALCAAWGVARTTELAAPTGITIQDLIPGFYRNMLRDRSSELVGVLPGRSEAHVAGLARAFTGERRDASRLVRADLAQGWTKYIQSQRADVRRDAETAIGAWMVSGRVPTFEAANA